MSDTMKGALLGGAVAALGGVLYNKFANKPSGKITLKYFPIAGAGEKVRC